MPLATLTNITYSIGQRVLLDGVSFAIEEGERVGLVGRNGAGKSTLMRILTGVLPPDSGQVNIRRGSRAGYLSQEPEFGEGPTLRDEAESAFAELHRLHAELDRVYHALAEPGNASGPNLQRLLSEQARLELEMEHAGGYAIGHKIDAVLHGLGLTDAEFGLPLAGLSGGQRARLALAKLLLGEPDLLLLDEPTNHLDIAGREWLENFLADEYRGAVLMVSHDRYMLDRVVGRIVEVEGAKLIEYPGDYTAYREVRAMRRLSQQRAYDKQQSKFRSEEAYIRRYKAGQRAKQARGRETRLARQKAESSLERPIEMEAFSIEFPAAPRSGDQAVIFQSATKTYPVNSFLADDADDVPASPPSASGERVLFRDLTLRITRGERWGIIGPNGAGKTTLVKALLGEVPLDSGSARLGSNVAVGYFRQRTEGYDPRDRLWEFLQRVIRMENPGSSMTEQAARDLAGAFLFSGREQDTAMGDLSGGERSRAMLAALLVSAKNLLILDEPTNHLDIPAAERLEEALSPPDDGGVYEGTLILISHDRALIDATCDHLLIFDGRGGVKEFAGNYSQWQEHERTRAIASARPATDGVKAKSAAAAAPARSDSPPAPAAPRPASAGKQAKGRNPLSWMSIEKLEAAMAAASAEVARLDALLADPRTYADAQACRRVPQERADAKATLDEIEEEWLRRAEG